MTGQIISLLVLTGNKKKSTNIHLVVDDGEILETTQRENIPWLDIIDVYPDTQNNNQSTLKRVSWRSTMSTKQRATKHLEK